MDAVSAAPARRSHRQLLGRASAGHSLAGAPGSKSGSPLRVAMLAPPWISVPAPGYGGVESVVSTLTEALVRRGHDVTLFCAPGSVSRANVVTLLDKSHPDEIERSLYEVDQVGRAFDAIDSATGSDPFDVVHDHCGFTGLAMANRIATPLVHTLHGPFTPETAALVASHGKKRCVSDSFGKKTLTIHAAGSYTVRLTANAATQRALSSGKTLHVRETLTFTTAGGKPIVKTFTVMVHGKQAHRKH